MTYRDVRFFFRDLISGDIHRGLCRTIGVQQFITPRRIDTHQFLAAGNQYFHPLDIGIVDRHLGAHLGGHKDVGNPFLLEIIVHALQIKANIFADDIDGATHVHTSPQVVHEGIETIAGVRSVPALRHQADEFGVAFTESEDILFTQHHTFWCTCRTRCIKQNESVFAVIFGGIAAHKLQTLFRITAVQRHSCHTGFGDRERHDDHLLVARHGITDHMFAARDRVLRIKGIRQFVHLGVRQTFVTGYHADSVRMFRHVLLEDSDQTFLCTLYFVPLSFILVKPCNLFRRAVIDVFHRLSVHHRAYDRAVAFHYLLDKRLRIIACVITDLKQIVLFFLD